MTGYLIAFGSGLFTGIAVAVLLKDAWFVALPVIRHAKKKPKGRPVDEQSNRVGYPSKFLIVLVIAVAALQVGVGGGLLLTRIDNAQQAREIAAATKDLKAFAECQAEYNQAYAERVDAITGPSTKVSDAIHTFLQATFVVLRPGSTPAEAENFTETLSDYLVLYDRLKKAREENPLPPLPDQTCGATP